MRLQAFQETDNLIYHLAHAACGAAVSVFRYLFLYLLAYLVGNMVGNFLRQRVDAYATLLYGFRDEVRNLFL